MNQLSASARPQEDQQQAVAAVDGRATDRQIGDWRSHRRCSVAYARSTVPFIRGSRPVAAPPAAVDPVKQTAEAQQPQTASLDLGLTLDIDSRGRRERYRRRRRRAINRDGTEQGKGTPSAGDRADGTPDLVLLGLSGDGPARPGKRRNPFPPHPGGDIGDAYRETPDMRWARHPDAIATSRSHRPESGLRWLVPPRWPSPPNSDGSAPTPRSAPATLMRPQPGNNRVTDRQRRQHACRCRRLLRAASRAYSATATTPGRRPAPLAPPFAEPDRDAEAGAIIISTSTARSARACADGTPHR